MEQRQTEKYRSLGLNIAYYRKDKRFTQEQLAESLNLQLRRQGVPSRVVMEDNLFKVRVGDFRTLDNAVAIELKLMLLGYNTFVVS